MALCQFYLDNFAKVSIEIHCQWLTSDIIKREQRCVTWQYGEMSADNMPWPSFNSVSTFQVIWFHCIVLFSLFCLVKYLAPSD